jgi:anaerobic carbon-monoxide dehydrogenase, CODH/ACS complex subunit alpha
VAQTLKRTGSHVISDAEATKQCKEHKQDCDLCTSACPLSLPVSKAVRELAGGDWKGFAEVERGCNFCGKCDEVCPSKVQLRSIIVAAERKQAAQDKYLMRPGRGPFSITELLQSAFAVGWGSIPAMITIYGCGDAHKDEVAWIADELLNSGYMAFTAGCAAAEMGRSFNPAKKKFLMQQYNATAAARNLVNCGSCSGICHSVPMYMMLRPSGGISLFGNIPPLGDSIFLGGAQSIIIWGAMPDRMYAVAAAWARMGSTVIVGPASSLGWNRYLAGDRYDRSKWWVYHGETGEKREVEPAKEHLIVPVETKEEALTMLARSVVNVKDYRESRLTHLEVLIDFYNRFYDQLPEDWHLFVRSDFELPPRYRKRIVNLLGKEHGWEANGMKLSKARHRDGRVMNMSEFAASYGMEQGIYSTRLISQTPLRLREKVRENAEKGK